MLKVSFWLQNGERAAEGNELMLGRLSRRLYKSLTEAETWMAALLLAAEVEGRDQIHNTEGSANKTEKWMESGSNMRVCTRNASLASAMKREWPFNLHTPL